MVITWYVTSSFDISWHFAHIFITDRDFSPFIIFYHFITSRCIDDTWCQTSFHYQEDATFIFSADRNIDDDDVVCKHLRWAESCREKSRCRSYWREHFHAVMMKHVLSLTFHYKHHYRRGDYHDETFHDYWTFHFLTLFFDAKIDAVEFPSSHFHMYLSCSYEHLFSSFRHLCRPRWCITRYYHFHELSCCRHFDVGGDITTLSFSWEVDVHWCKHYDTSSGDYWQMHAFSSWCADMMKGAGSQRNICSHIVNIFHFIFIFRCHLSFYVTTL